MVKLEEQKRMPIARLTFDEEMYPRAKWSWLTAYQYSQAMLAGNQFPPIVVGLLGENYYLIDGKHRIEAKRMNNELDIDVIVRYFNNKRAMYEEAVRLNSFHGRQFSQQEKVMIITKLREYQFTPPEISMLTGITEAKLAPFVAKRTGYNEYNQEAVPLKAPFKGMAGEQVSKEFEDIQEGFSSGSQMHILLEFYGLLKMNALDMENRIVRAKLEDIYETLGAMLKRKRRSPSKRATNK